MYNSRSDRVRRVRVRLVVVGGRAPAPAPGRRRVRRPRRPARAVPAHGRRATGACSASPGSSSRAPSGLVLHWFGGERWEFDEAGLPVRADQGPGHRRALHARGRARWPSCATGRQDACACTGATSGSRRSSAPTGAASTYRYDDGDLVEADGARRAPLRGRRGQGALGHRRRRRRRGRQRLRRAGPRPAPALPVRPQHGLRLPARPRDGHQRRQRRPDQRLHPRHRRPAAVADRRRRDPRLRSPTTAGATRSRSPTARAPSPCRSGTSASNLKRRVLPTGVEFTFTHDDADRVARGRRLDRRELPATRYEGDERSPAELIDAEGGVTRLTVERRARARDRRPRRRAAAASTSTPTATSSPPPTPTATSPGSSATPAGLRDRGDLAARAPHDVRARRARPRRSSAASRAARCGATSTRRPGALTAVDRSRRRARGDPLRRARRARRRPSIRSAASRRTATTSSATTPTIVAPDGATWRFAYDELCRLTAHRRPDRARPGSASTTPTAT